MYGHMKHTNSHNYTEEGDRKVHNERMQYNLHHREQSQCDKEIPMSAVLSFMFLIMPHVVSCDSNYRSHETYRIFCAFHTHGPEEAEDQEW